MEYLEESLEEWLGGELEPFGDDDYLLFVRCLRCAALCCAGGQQGPGWRAA